MEEERAKYFMLLVMEKLPAELYVTIKEQLLKMDQDEVQTKLLMMKNPMTSLLISIFAGIYGIDRMYIGDTLLGVIKLITCGGFGVWWFIDLFLIIDKTKGKNLEIFMR